MEMDNIMTEMDSMFTNNGWYPIQKDTNRLSYTKKGNETDVFDIAVVGPTNVRVGVPMKNSTYQFVTTFKDCMEANTYVKSRFYEFITLSTF